MLMGQRRRQLLFLSLQQSIWQKQFEEGRANLGLGLGIWSIKLDVMAAEMLVIHSQEEWVPWIGLLGSSSFHLVRDPGLWNGAASVLTPIYLIQKIIPETYPGVNSVVMPSPMELTIKGNHLTKQPHPLGHKSKITLQERGRRGVEGQKQPRLRIYRNATRHATLC